MSTLQRVRQMSQQEVAGIDPKNVSYYTLTDGTIVHIKNEDPGQARRRQFQRQNIYMSQAQKSNSKSKYNFKNQNIYTVKSSRFHSSNSVGKKRLYKRPRFITINQYQKKQPQYPPKKEQPQNEKKVQKQLNSSSRIIIRNKKSNNFLQPGDNYGYYNSNNPNYSRIRQNSICTCKSQMPVGYINYNAKLINGQVIDDQLIEQLELKYLTNSPYVTLNQFGGINKKQLYKLVQALPVPNTDDALYNQSNSQIIFKQYKSNNYIGRPQSVNIREKSFINQKYTQNDLNTSNGNFRYFNRNESQNGGQEEFQESVYQGGEEYYNTSFKVSNVSQRKSNVVGNSLYCSCSN